MKNPGLSRHRTGKRFALAAVSSFALLAGVAYAGGWASRALRSFASTSKAVAPEQGESGAARRTRTRNLALQPAAQNFSRRVGRRFTERGREESILVGKLTAGGEQRNVRIRRLQDAGGERVEVALGGGQAGLAWDDESGALSSGVAAAGAERALLERLVLDSPDQFALAQLRGASYYTVASGVRETGDGGADGYAGPLYNIVRVGEPAREDGRGWAGAWRLYHVDTVTGLVGKIISEDEDGALVEATLSEWVTRDGETLPARTTWTRGGEVFMELTIQNAGHGPQQ